MKDILQICNGHTVAILTSKQKLPNRPAHTLVCENEAPWTSVVFVQELVSKVVLNLLCAMCRPG